MVEINVFVSHLTKDVFIMKAFRPLFQTSETSELLKPSFLFHLESTHLICTANQTTVFYMKLKTSEIVQATFLHGHSI